MVGTSSANVGGLRGVAGRDGGEQRGRRGNERGNEHVRGCDLTRYAAIRRVHRGRVMEVRAENWVWKLGERRFLQPDWIFFRVRDWRRAKFAIDSFFVTASTYNGISKYGTYGDPVLCFGRAAAWRSATDDFSTLAGCDFRLGV